jgi:hypothetical protein
LRVRTLLLSLRDAAFASPGALLEAASATLAEPAAYLRTRRGGQIAVSAIFPLLTTISAVVGVIWIGRNRAAMPDAAEAANLLTWAGLWVIAMASAAGTSMVTVFLSMLGAIVTGSGFTFRPLGAALVNTRGQRASRVRALWRSIVTWAPMCALMIAVKLSPKPPDYRVGLVLVQVALMAVVAAGIAWAVHRPSRSIQDRLSGTWIVPR